MSHSNLTFGPSRLQSWGGAAVAAVLLSAAAAAQVPSQVAKITNLDTSSGAPELEYQNIGTKALTAVVMQNLTPEHKGEIVAAEYPSAPLDPGQSRRLPVWTGLDAGKLASQIVIAAVIFADGTHLGATPDPAYNGVDAVDEIFEQRRGVAAELAKWAKLVSALSIDDDHAALEQFMQAAARLNPAQQQHTQYEIGVAQVQAGMRVTGERIATLLKADSDPKSVRAKYLGQIVGRAASAQKAANEDAALVTPDIECGSSCNHNCAGLTSTNYNTIGLPPPCGALPGGFAVNWDWNITLVNNATLDPIRTTATTVNGNGWCAGAYTDCWYGVTGLNTPYMYALSTMNPTTFNWSWRAEVWQELPGGVAGAYGVGCAGVQEVLTTPINMGSYVCDCTSCSPIVIDTAGEGFHLTSTNNGVMFREHDGSPKFQLSWTDPGYRNGWLALPNKEGQVRSLADLFGDFTPQPPSPHPNGYRALAYFAAQQGCGTLKKPLEDIDASNCPAAWHKLRVWIDANHDGVAQPEELHTLESVGLQRISLRYHTSERVDEYGNRFLYVAGIEDAEGKKDNRCYDVFLKAK